MWKRFARRSAISLLIGRVPVRIGEIRLCGATSSRSHGSSRFSSISGKRVHRFKPGGALTQGWCLTDKGYENAFRAVPGDALNLIDLDHGVVQINWPRRNQAEVQILRVHRPGDSVIAISNRPATGCTASFGSTTAGARRCTTHYRAGVDAGNLIGSAGVAQRDLC
jgi:hemolysin activation/secretion protein